MKFGDKKESNAIARKAKNWLKISKQTNSSSSKKIKKNNQKRNKRFTKNAN